MSETDPGFTFEDVEYLRHDDKPLLARVYTPDGEGPFAAVVELHGGAWTRFDRTRGKSLHESLARNGVVVVALDFRQGPEGAYPRSVADIHYGIRWVKANAARLNVDPDRVALSGNSSGGTLGMLVAMRPDDPRYAQIPMPQAPDIDARVRCIVMLWPVIDPLGRYRNAKSKVASGERSDIPWQDLVDMHDGYWLSEENQADGSPLRVLRRGDEAETPDALWVQVQDDPVHDYVSPDGADRRPQAEQFVDAYRRAGGTIELEYFDAPMMFATVHPTLPESIAALDRIAGFVAAHTQERNLV